jgi:hypothetical protein
MEVRVAPRLPGVQKITAGVIMAFASAMFVAGGATHPASFGGVLFLLLGGAGLLLCLGTAVVAAGNVVSRRPVLVLEDSGVRVPPLWPLPRSRDRVLAWADVAAVCAWVQGPPSDKKAAALGRLYLSFLPSGEGVDNGAELLATKVTGLGCRATLRWTARVSPGWDATIEEVVAEAAGHRAGAPFVDKRELPKPKRKRRTRRPARPSQRPTGSSAS